MVVTVRSVFISANVRTEVFATLPMVDALALLAGRDVSANRVNAASYRKPAVFFRQLFYFFGSVSTDSLS